MYQLWAHQMYPKTNFEETVETIETVCRKRRMQVRSPLDSLSASQMTLIGSLALVQSALKDWRQEAFGVKKPRTGAEADGDADLANALNPDGTYNPPPPQKNPSTTADDAAQVDFSHDPDGEMFDDSFLDDFDIDNFDAPSKSSAFPPPRGTTTTIPAPAAPKPLFAPADEDEEAEAAMREAERFEEDEEAERAMREMEEMEMDEALSREAKATQAAAVVAPPVPEPVAEKMVEATVVEKDAEVAVEKAPEAVAAAVVEEQVPPEDDWDLYA